MGCYGLETLDREEYIREEITPILNIIIKCMPSCFPYMCCSLASEELCKRKRFLFITGYYTGPLSNEYQDRLKDNFQASDIHFIKHDFVYDQYNKLFIDLTARQFHLDYPPVLVMEDDDPRIVFFKSQLKKTTTHYVKEVGLVATA